MAKSIVHIYDKICKRILTLSSKSVINLINGLYGTDYPTDSSITYNWTEFEDTKLKRTLADTIITINNKYSYHLEIQMTIDEEIIFRVIEYGFGHAYKNRVCEKGRELLPFPEPKIIYLSENDIEKVPEVYSVELDFGKQGRFTYNAPVTILHSMTSAELTNRKMIILIPFFLLKLRSTLTQSRSEENKKALKHLIEHDIVNSIQKNLDIGNISAEDANILHIMIQKLYRHIYAHFEELEDITMMIDESLDLPIDNLYAKIEKLENTIDEKDSIIGEKDSIIGEKDTLIDAMASEIETLKKQLEELSFK